MKADELVNKTMTAAQSLESDQIHDYFNEMAILSIGVLRGLHGDKFINDYLTAALNDKKALIIKANKLQ